MATRDSAHGLLGAEEISRKPKRWVWGADLSPATSKLRLTQTHPQHFVPMTRVAFQTEAQVPQKSLSPEKGPHASQLLKRGSVTAQSPGMPTLYRDSIVMWQVCSQGHDDFQQKGQGPSPFLKLFSAIAPNLGSQNHTIPKPYFPPTGKSTRLRVY